MSNVISQTDQLTVYTQPKPFVLIQPTACPPRGIGIIVDPTCWGKAMQRVCTSTGPVAFDVETRGLDPTLPDNYVVGVGFAGESPDGEGFNYYFDCTGEGANLGGFDWIARKLVLHSVPLIAHNAYFDGAWIYESVGKHANWESCTYALYRQLATEGWTGQRWGLKEAMQDVLLWESANDDGISQWLVTNGYVNGSGNPLKAEMWRCPPEILGQYCLLDAEATWLLYTRVLRPVMDRFPALKEHHQRDFLCLIRRLIEQKLHGMEVDRDGLVQAQMEIEAELGPMEKWIRTESDLAPYIKQWEQARRAEFLLTEPKRHKKPPKLGTEPPYKTKAGEISKVWLNWHKKKTNPPVQSKTWENWEERRLAVEAGEIPYYCFNLRSGDHLRWLFFDAMQCTPVEYTKKGLPKADTESLRTFGPGGAKLQDFHLTHKELSFVVDFLNRTQLRSTIHPGFRTPGTVTGRLSGVEPNIQQVPKSRRFLQCLRARPGHVWIDADVTSLEPVVCTELSGDEQLMQVFGPDAPPGSDIYLHTGLGLPHFRDQIVSAGYDPTSMTAEGAAAAKKQCKAIRSICKVLYLSSSYGAGPRKIHKTLVQQGVDINLEQVQELHAQYWEYYGGIKQWEKQLKQEHRVNKGWVMNGIGRPIGVHQDADRLKDKRKDIVNRVVQSTGHDLLVQYLRILSEGLDATGIKWYPIIWDFHDECLVEVPEADAEMAMETFREAQDILNKELGGTIPLRINPVVVRTLADAKLED